jgi:hypothetical protein
MPLNSPRIASEKLLRFVNVMNVTILTTAFFFLKLSLDCNVVGADEASNQCIHTFNCNTYHWVAIALTTMRVIPL